MVVANDTPCLSCVKRWRRPPGGPSAPGPRGRFGTIATPGTAQDATLDELVLASLFPADETTAFAFGGWRLLSNKLYPLAGPQRRR